jgi:hypothetical protein
MRRTGGGLLSEVAALIWELGDLSGSGGRRDVYHWSLALLCWERAIDTTSLSKLEAVSLVDLTVGSSSPSTASSRPSCRNQKPLQAHHTRSSDEWRTARHDLVATTTTRIASRTGSSGHLCLVSVLPPAGSSIGPKTHSHNRGHWERHLPRTAAAAAAACRSSISWWYTPSSSTRSTTTERRAP